MASVTPYSKFDVEEDCHKLRKAMKGLGTDEKAITKIIANRSNKQRQVIRSTYKQSYGKNLIDELKSELSGNYERVVISLMKDPVEFAVDTLHKAMNGAGTNEDALIDILTSHNNEQLHQINVRFDHKYKSSLESWIRADSSGDFERFLVSLNNGKREKDQEVDPKLVKKDVKHLYKAGEARWGTDESVFNFVLGTRSHKHIRAVAKEYEEETGNSLKSVLKKELSGNLRKAMVAILQISIDKHLYFAKKLHKTMKGVGTDDKGLIRTIVLRSEIDLEIIKKRYHKEQKMKLVDRISDDVSGDYKKILQEIVD